VTHEARRLIGEPGVEAGVLVDGAGDDDDPALGVDVVAQHQQPLVIPAVAEGLRGGTVLLGGPRACLHMQVWAVDRTVAAFLAVMAATEPDPGQTSRSCGWCVFR